jgi:D-methionine transport system permease protein
MSEPMLRMLLNGLWETIVMTFVSGFFGFVIGLPAGVVLFLTRDGQILENRPLNRLVAAVVNVFRSIPFIIGVLAALVPLSVGAAPFVGRMVENSLLEVPHGLIEAARAMGATPLQIVRKVLLPEALPSIVNGASITLIALVGYSAMGGAVGAGGLGQIGYQYGYVGYDIVVMNTVLVLLVALVFLIQFTGQYIARKVDHRK